jgi:hypothetical protein
MGRALLQRRDFYAGGLMVLFGLVMAIKGPSYKTGTLMHMGPGFMPTALGVILILLGLLIIGGAAVTPASDDEGLLPDQPEWLAWACILASPVCFILFGTLFGLAPATFSCVFIAAMGDREATWKSATVLSAIVTVFGVLLFSYVLQVPMPVLTWRGL